MIIRDYLDKDFEDFLAIENESFVHPWTRQNLIDEFEKNNTRKTLVAEIDNHIVAFLNVWEAFDTSSIAQVAVKKEFRRQGIAEALFKEMETYLLSKGTEFITLEVRVSNIPAQKFYEKVGFSKIVIKPQYYVNGEDAIYMVKELLWH